MPRPETQPSVVMEFAELMLVFGSLGLKVETTSELFIVQGGDSENEESCCLKTVGELRAYLRGVEAAQLKRINRIGDW